LLKDDASMGQSGGRRFNLRKILVVAETAIALALLVAAGLFVRSLRASQAVEAGIDRDRVVSMPLTVNLLRYTRAQGREFYRHAIERATSLPGVEGAAVARVAVFGAGSLRSLQIEGRQGSHDQFRSDGSGLSPGARTDVVNSNVVSPGYFRTMGIAAVGGRDFGSDDLDTSPPVVIVNQTFAERHFPGISPIGARISVNGPSGPWREIVGVVRASKYSSLIEAPTPIVYLPLSQNHETGVTLYVRTSVAPDSVMSLLRREIQTLEPNLPLPSVQSMQETIATSLYPARMAAWLVGVFGVLALALASIGVYGVLAFSISRRQREMGVRMALGATARDILRLVVGEGLWLIVLGIGIGLGGAAFGSGLLARFLYGVSPTDGWTFAVVPLILGVVGLIACLIPARRAMRVEPTTALRLN
jgi:predicted permease